MTATACGTFDVELVPGSPELDGEVSRFEFRKEFQGDLEGSGNGVMLSGGDPSSGSAGYVAIEVVRGVLHGRSGDFALAQVGMMNAGTQSLQYEIVPGSGKEELAGITGSLRLTIEGDGTHRYELTFQI